MDSIKLFVRKIKACKGRDFTSLLKPFAIVPGYCITIRICDSLLQTQLLGYLLLSGLLHVLEGILRHLQGT